MITIFLEMIHVGFIYPIACHWAWGPRGWLNVGVPGATYQVITFVYMYTAIWIFLTLY